MPDDTPEAPAIEIDRAAAAAGGPGLLTIGGRTLIVRHPTPADFFALQDYAKGLAAAGARSPVKAIAEQLADIPAEFRAEFIREAIAQSKGEAAPEPTREAVAEKAQGYEGATWFTWWLARETHPELTVDDVRKLCPPEQKHELQAALLAAIRLEDRRDPKAP